MVETHHNAKFRYMRKSGKKNLNKSNSSIQSNFYNTHSADYLSYEKNIPYARYLGKIVLNQLSGNKDQILEVGAGQGRFTFEIASRVGSIYATDVSVEELKILKKKIRLINVNNISVYHYDLLNPVNTFGKETWDHILGFFILHHLPKEKLNDVVYNLQKKLSKNGRMIFIEPNNLYPFHLVEMLITPDMEWEIEKGIYTDYIGCFKKACRKNGMRIISSRKFGFVPPPVINRLPASTHLDYMVEKIPVVREIFCPFILLTAEKI